MKLIPAHVYCFDAEWVPCVRTGRLLSKLADSASDDEVRNAMWKRAGATEQIPHPFLKMAVSRLVSISAIHREQRGDGTVHLSLKSYPDRADPEVAEGKIIGPFLDEVAAEKAQLVGFNSSGSDLPLLLQRGIASCCRCAGFGDRPNKPWEGMDYLNRFSEAHLDLASILTAGAGGRGAAMPSLDEIAAALLIPGKLDHSGAGVLDFWLKGDFATLTGYNETDACTTYLVWLHTAWFFGKFTAKDITVELTLFRSLLTDLAPGKPHLQQFLDEWDRRRSLAPEVSLPAPAAGHPARVRITAARRGRRGCWVIWLDADTFASELASRLSPHLEADGDGGFYLCEIGYDADGNVARGTKDQEPLLLEVKTADLPGILFAVQHAKVHGTDDKWAA